MYAHVSKAGPINKIAKHHTHPNARPSPPPPLSQLAAMAERRLHLTDPRAVSAALRLFTSSPFPSSPPQPQPQGQGGDSNGHSKKPASPPQSQGQGGESNGHSQRPASPHEVVALVAALRRVQARLDVVHYTTAINHAGKAAPPSFPSSSSCVDEGSAAAAAHSSSSFDKEGAPVAAALSHSAVEGAGAAVTAALSHEATAAAPSPSSQTAGGGTGAPSPSHQTEGGGAERARLLLRWMEEDGVRPNDVTYTSLIHILGQASEGGR